MAVRRCCIIFITSLVVVFSGVSAGSVSGGGDVRRLLDGAVLYLLFMTSLVVVFSGVRAGSVSGGGDVRRLPDGAVLYLWRHW